MTDEFLTKGLEEDRYVKALQLVDQFESEIEALLFEFDQRMVDQHPDLFDSSTDPNVKSQRSSSALAIHRLNHSMKGPLAPTEGKAYTMNVHLYWMPPTEYGRTDIDGALRAFGYKIKHADRSIDTRVAEQTRAGDWSVEMSGNPYDKNTVFYRHVSSAAEIEETADILVRHFSEFGDEYAMSPDA
ncbi:MULTISPECIES: hypothetical protein [Haloferax]|uniref:Uncharacterized protein n=2 Tax=Haloferax TaxID=2251 RepID=A0A6G1YYG3_9EURY|nr:MULTISPECIES: hypothetical protein [Haloferax]KAB1186620.1 hypothetical protein Hfx1149_00670 [Haloferax sp. CBA1149]MRW79238.1 hypothetical protein [Haloferax marinisediminis]